MHIEIWTYGQLVVDLVILGVLVWFLKSQSRHRLSWREHEASIQRSEALLGEMRDIARSLERNLEEKRLQSRQLLSQLDQGLKRAEESYNQLCQIMPQSGEGFAGDSSSIRDRSRTRDSVRALLETGLKKEEIARHLGISIGEIDLLLKLDPSPRPA